jgi:hypothetical protein
MLRLLMISLPATLFGCKSKDYFDKELVCTHVYNLSHVLPDPLFEQPGKEVPRSKNKEYFQIGLPELILCRNKIKFLDMFQYYWPISRSDIQQLKNSVTILYKKPVIEKINELKNLQKIVEQQNKVHQGQNDFLSIFLTLNDHTKYGCPFLVDIGRRGDIDELVIFKDPSRPPYLCSYPSRQKGFKKPPPYGANVFKIKFST